MSGLAVRAWARGRFLFVFLLLFSLCQMGGLERKEQEEGAISATVQAKHQPQPWIERLGHYEGLVGSGESIVQEIILCSFCRCQALCWTDKKEFLVMSAEKLWESKQSTDLWSLWNKERQRGTWRTCFVITHHQNSVGSTLKELKTLSEFKTNWIKGCTEKLMYCIL